MPNQQTEEDYRNRYLLQGIAMGPANKAEIDQLQLELGHDLPIAYRAYLRVWGTHPPKSLVGSDCVMSDLHDNKTAAIEILADDGAEWSLPTNAVVFLMHQGYVFFYFDATESSDPTVFSYYEGERIPVKVTDRFSDWVIGL